MFEKFGEFDTAEELNRAARAQLDEGDLEAVEALAEENGIDYEDTKDYIDGYTTELCSPLMAAIGKLNVERRSLNLPTSMEAWIYMLNEMLTMDSKKEELAAGIRKKGKTLVGLMGQLLKLSSQNRKEVPKEIVKAAGINGSIFVGDVDHETFKKTVKSYYLQ